MNNIKPTAGDLIIGLTEGSKPFWVDVISEETGNIYGCYVIPGVQEFVLWKEGPFRKVGQAS